MKHSVNVQTTSTLSHGLRATMSAVKIATLVKFLFKIRAVYHLMLLTVNTLPIETLKMSLTFLACIKTP